MRCMIKLHIPMGFYSDPIYLTEVSGNCCPFTFLGRLSDVLFMRANPPGKLHILNHPFALPPINEFIPFKFAQSRLNWACIRRGFLKQASYFLARFFRKRLFTLGDYQRAGPLDGRQR